MKHEPIDMDEFWPYQLAVLADLVNKYTLSVLKTQGALNLSQWRVLVAVADQPGRSSAEVVAITPMDKGIVSRAVATLIEEGLLRKQADPTDKRRSELFLTPAGDDLYRAVSAIVGANHAGAQDDDFNLKLHGYIERLRDMIPRT